MPALGMAQESGRIVRWLKDSGDSVRQGEPLLQIETDKSVVELEAPADGLLRIVLDATDEAVPIGDIIGWIGAQAEEAPQAAHGARGDGVPASPGLESPENLGAEPMPPAEELRAPAPGRPDRVPMSPKARRLARENGVDIAALAAGDGPLHAQDVARVASTATAPASDVGHLQRWNGIGEAMATRTAMSWRQAPHFYLMRDIDATALGAWLAAVRRDLPDATLTDLLIRVTAHALRRYPGLNASPADGGSFVHEAVNIGIAVATERGLVVPVVHEADKLGLPAIVLERLAVLSRAREGRPTPSDLRGGTFTISNLGMYGIDQFLPVLNLDEALLLAVGRMHEKVVVDRGKIVARPTMALTLACDHRVVDGASAAEFLREVVTILEQPVTLIG